MHLWHDSLSSKDLLEACAAFAMGLTFVNAFRWEEVITGYGLKSGPK
jgi:hypothetical protein